jgi:hypothetical protein
MKKTMLYLVLTLIAGLFLVHPVMAGKISNKQAAQQKRIQQGISKGSLTKAEARVLQKEQRKIRKVKQRFLADGVLSKGERLKLAALQKQADAHIRRLKHNKAVRPRDRARRQKPGFRYHCITAGQPLGQPV